MTLLRRALWLCKPWFAFHCSGYRDNIHNRVNYAVIDSQLVIEEERDEVRLELRIDTVICPIIEYFEIFLTRMQMCNRACEYLGTSFSLVINDNVLL